MFIFVSFSFSTVAVLADFCLLEPDLSTDLDWLRTGLDTIFFF